MGSRSGYNVSRGSDPESVFFFRVGFGFNQSKPDPELGFSPENQFCKVSAGLLFRYIAFVTSLEQDANKLSIGTKPLREIG